ncbi:unnamed protein product, partial [Cuscuta epithymum]
MGNKKISSYFSKKPVPSNDQPNLLPRDRDEEDNIASSQEGERPSKVPRVEINAFDISSLERDPGLRRLIWDYDPNKQEEVRRAYIKLGPFQPIPPKSPNFVDKNGRRFLPSWYKLYPDWLEFSPSKNGAYCLPCFLFNKPFGRHGNTFTVDGFRSWKKVNEGSQCPLFNHVGKDPNSLHKKAIESYLDLKNSSQHIERVIEKQTSEQVARNRLQLKVSIDAVMWLTFQGCAFRGRDETVDSKNRGNFLELVRLLASYNEEVKSVVLENAPRNASYTSPSVQKEILSVLATKIQQYIREEIGNSKFCILIDEARDESKREQMAIVLRFVDKEGFIRERFFDIVHVKETTSLALEKEISEVLSRHCLSVKDIRGQGYDGASNMRGEWNGLQALISQKCPFAYYVHCLAHRLQLTLVATSKEVIPVNQFFSYLSTIVNLVLCSCKRIDQLRDFESLRIEEMINTGDIETGKGKNQVGTLQRPGDTRWGSHLTSLRSLLRMFNSTCDVLRDIIKSGSLTQRSEADGVYDVMTSFEFVFILHLMIDVLAVTDDLSQALQRKSQDILNAMHLVSSTKDLLQKMREHGWDSLLDKVKLFCPQHEIEIPDFSAAYKAGRGRPRLQRNNRDFLTVEHHYKFDIFNSVVDKLMLELNYRFNEDVVELLVLSSALDPRDDYKSFQIEDICKLVSKFYPDDFSVMEKEHLRIQLEHFKYDAKKNPELKKASTLAELCELLTKTQKSIIYPLLDRVIRLLLTLPVSTATTERAFSAMKIVKTCLRNKMEDDFLSTYLVTYIERDIARGFSVDSL